MAAARRVVIVTLLVALLGLFFGVYQPARRGTPFVPGKGAAERFEVPSRASTLERLESEEFDLVIIGGGASGAAAALEAVHRNLSVALIEAEDFGAGTSSRSTKLLHGGVRYLRKALQKRDISQYTLVREALRERSFLFHMAPHLTDPLPIVTPLYDWRDVPGNYLLLKLYDYLSFPKLASSEWMSAAEVKKTLPMVRTEGLVGGVVYYDGKFDDARLDLAFSLTAAHKGAAVINHAPVVGITHNDEGNVSGVVFTDISGRNVTVASRGVINAAGHFADVIRMLDHPEAKPVLTASSGVHIVLDSSHAPPNHGILIPKTDDGRVVFIHPWQGHAIVGTTDSPTEVTNNPRPTKEALDYLLAHASKYLDFDLSYGDIKSAWSGIRPLKRATDDSDTAAVSREHAIYTSPSNLLSIVGGKWTTTRRMAVDIINRAVETYGFDAPEIADEDPRSTAHSALVGGSEYAPAFVETIASMGPLGQSTAYRLNKAYGDQAIHVVNLALRESLAAPLAPYLPYIEAEVVWAVRNEYAMDIVDVVARRLSLALVDNEAAIAVAVRVGVLMQRELGWTDEQLDTYIEEAREYLSISQ